MYDFYLFDFHDVLRAIGVVGFAFGDGVDDFKALDNLAVDSVLAVEERGSPDGSVGVALLLAHGETWGGCRGGLAHGVDDAVGLLLWHSLESLQVFCGVLVYGTLACGTPLLHIHPGDELVDFFGRGYPSLDDVELRCAGAFFGVDVIAGTRGGESALFVEEGRYEFGRHGVA